MLQEWIISDWKSFLLVGVSCFLTYASIIVYTRLGGLRSFSKMSAPDFAMTVAVGSLFATTIATAKPQLLLGIFGIGSLFLGQWIVASLREKFNWFECATDNDPILLMAGNRILHENLHRTHVTLGDLHAKLREANVLNYDQVRAVVFETTGDVSVLHTSDQSIRLEPEILKSVVDRDQLETCDSDGKS